MNKIAAFFVASVIAFSSIYTINATEILHKNTGPSAQSQREKEGIFSIDTRINGQALSLQRQPDQPDDCLTLQNKEDKVEQRWIISNTGENLYTIVSVANGLAIGVSDPNNMEESSIVMGEYQNQTSQKWVIKENENGECTILSAVNSKYTLQYNFYDGLALSVANGNIYQVFKFDFIRPLVSEAEVEYTLDSVVVDAQSQTNGKFNVVINVAKSNAILSGAVIEVHPEKDKSKTKTYYARVNENGQIVQEISSEYHGYESGTYVVNCSLLLDGRVLSELGTYKCDVVDPYKNLESQISQYIESNKEADSDWQVVFSDVVRGKKVNQNSHQTQSVDLCKLFVMGAIYDEYDAVCAAYSENLVDNCLSRMIAANGNDAFLSLLFYIGDGDYGLGADKVTSWANEHGYKDVSLTYGGTDYLCSARDVAQFLTDVVVGKYGHGEDMLNLMAAQTQRNKIPASLPAEVVSKNKAGGTDGTECDAAVVYSANGPYVLVVMGNNYTYQANAQTMIRMLSSNVYNYIMS